MKVMFWLHVLTKKIILLTYVISLILMMKNETILTEEIINDLWHSDLFLPGYDEFDELFLFSCIRYGSVKEMMDASEVALHALFVDNGVQDSTPIFEWINEMVYDSKVFPFTIRVSEVIPRARKAFEAKLAEYRKEGWLPRTYDVDYAFRGMMGLIYCIVYQKYFEKYERLQQMGRDAIYKTSGLFKKTYTIVSLPQWDELKLRDIEPDCKYDRFDSAVLLYTAMERNDMQDNTDENIQLYVRIKKTILNSDDKLGNVKRLLESMASTSKERDLYAYLYTSIVLESVCA